jgi:hypothetical protein
MYEHGEPSEGFPVVDLSSSEEEDAFPDTSRDEEITRKLFGGFNRGLLGPPGDGRIIILNDSDEERRCTRITTSMPKSCYLLLETPRLQPPPPPTMMMHPNEVQDYSSGIDRPDLVQGGSSDGGDEAGTPYATMPKGESAGACTEEFENNNDSALLHHKFFCKEK